MPTRTKSNPISLIHAVSAVVAAIMSREPAFLFLLISCYLFAFSGATPEDCLEFDVGQLEDYLSRLDFENVPTINMMISGFKCPVTALPFGALRSDWARLLLLRNAQPRQSILREKLARLFRILTLAYLQMEERFDVDTSARSSPAAAGVDGERNATLDVSSTNVVPLPAGNNQTANGIEGTHRERVRSFNRTLTNRIKVKRPAVNRKIPSDVEFWGYTSAPARFTSIAFTPATEDRFTSGRSRKRGSPDADTRKNLRWFYNFAEGHDGDSSGDRRGADIRCAAGKSDDK